MAEKVVKLGIKREPGFLYFLRGTDVYKTPMKRAGAPSAAGKAEKVTHSVFNREDGHLYYLDSNGDISRAKRAIGGQKRKTPSSTTKKTSTKPISAKKTTVSSTTKKTSGSNSKQSQSKISKSTSTKKK